ncbi:MAG: hypothetical protein RXR59_02965 [Sulfolobus sp.]
MSLRTLENITSQLLGSIHINPNPLASALIIIGIAILMMIIIGGIIYGAIQAFRAVPNMPFSRFILLMLIISVFLIILGILIP